MKRLKYSALIGLLLLGVPLRADFSQGKFFHFQMPSGERIRAASWPGNPEKAHPTTIVFLQGRASFIEKNRELMESLTQMGFEVTTFDWPGQGGSHRYLANPQKGYIKDFQTYVDTLHQFLTTQMKPKTHHQVILLGLSLGGHIALRYLTEHPGVVSGALCVAPMLDVITDPYPRWMARLVSWGAHQSGASQAYAFGYGDYNPKASTFKTNKETQDPGRYARLQETMARFPHFVIGGPTFGWVFAAFQSMDKTQDPTYLARIQEPMMILTAGLDRIVDTHKDREICAQIPHCRHKLFPQAYHNIPLEKENIRQEFLATVATFARSLKEGVS